MIGFTVPRILICNKSAKTVRFTTMEREISELIRNCRGESLQFPV